MSFLLQVVDVFLHLDAHFAAVYATYGSFIYLILFLIIFCETGLVIIPFLPGDSLLFVAGAFAAKGTLHFPMLILIFAAAAIIGDSVNYALGRSFGNRVYKKNFWFLNREHLDEAKKFYEKHGAKTIVLARYLPIVRTFAPFVAGASHMHYRTFFWYNVFGGILWVCIGTSLGYLFGNIPIIERHFSVAVICVVLLSL
ncbi:MAG TPA: VTT domain-containing protein, partial [Candidatus Peribacteria bacterium]|nr:VTT domain-containing protein [Candidatus Peribacteria bacterium]